MTQDQIAILLILTATVAMFLWGRWRHDLVAAGALLASVFAGLVPNEVAFAGFGHPAVITVACVLVLSQGLQHTGAVDAIARRALPGSAGPVATIAALTGLGALLSAFMNNVGALALLMPVALQLSARHELPPGRMLMPLAFGTILGGMTTMIGTPPNLVVAGFREEAGLGSFAMFDFTPVGLAVAGTGVIFIALLGWRLVPTRKRTDTSSFDTGTYFTEVRITAGSKAADKPLREVEQLLEEADAQIVGMVRNNFRLTAPNPRRILRADDILVLEADHESITTAMSALGLQLEEAVAAGQEAEAEAKEKEAGETVTEAKAKKGLTRTVTATTAATTIGAAGEAGQASEEEDEDEDEKHDTGDIVIQELVVTPQADLIGRSATDLQLRTRFGLNLLAISRQGSRSISRLRTTRIAAGDVLLFQGAADALAGFAATFGCLPLAPRPIRIPDKRGALIATLVMVLAVCGAAFGLLPAAISFATGMLVFMGLRIVPLRKVYDAIDWPVIVLLGALMPIADAMAATGAADVLAKALLESVAQGHPVVALTLVLVVTMTLSDFTNNTATAAVMCPIAISTATQLGNSPDAFLMAVAIGASCSFLTPIGHQNNTLILGPGGFRFGDYWRMGLPLEVLVVAVSVPMLLWVWPL